MSIILLIVKLGMKMNSYLKASMAMLSILGMWVYFVSTLNIL